MKILFYLDEHYSQALDVSSIANQFNFSYGYLARLSYYLPSLAFFYGEYIHQIDSNRSPVPQSLY